MDCVIPAHSVRAFSAAVACLGKVGKELYVDFDPLDGLTLRTLNDAKSAYSAFRFSPAFFERCTAPPPARRSPRPASADRGGGGRGRKRDRSRGRSRDREGSRGRRSARDDDENEDDDDGRYMCRVPVRTVHSVLRPRKGVRSLRVRSAGMSPAEDSGKSQESGGVEEEADTESQEGSLMQLSFEFRVENSKTGGTMRIVHRVGVADADGVAAVAPRDGCSEIVAGPGVLLRMLEPLKRTAEVALTVDDNAKVVTATSFHHGDAVAAAAGSTENALLNAASASVLKTETSIGIDEFDDYNWRDDRNDETDAHEEDRSGGNPPPAGVNDEVTLVFGIKEAKAMLQFCAQANQDDEMRVVLSFHWGGRPITFDAEGEAFSAQLIMATLDHKLLGRGVRSNAGVRTGNARASSGGSGGRSNSR